MANSLALLADAGHMLTDVAALALSLFAFWVADRPATAKMTYGFYRAEILAALINGSVLIAISLFIFVEAAQRISAPPEVEGPLLMAVAAGGLVFNLFGLWMLHGGQQHSLNVRGAWLHMLGDTLGSVGALASGFLIHSYGWTWADPVASFLIGALVIVSAWHLLKETVAVLMESAPRGIDVDDVRESILGATGVQGVHDLHIWTITSGMESLSGHVVLKTGHTHQEVLEAVRRVLHERFGIDHITIQCEEPGLDEQICE